MSAPSWLRESADGVTLSVVVQPRASRTGAAGEHAGLLRIRLAAPPVDGAANDELVGWLAKTLRVRRNDVLLRTGTTSRRKIVEVRGVTAKQVLERFAAD